MDRGQVPAPVNHNDINLKAAFKECHRMSTLSDSNIGINKTEVVLRLGQGMQAVGHYLWRYIFPVEWPSGKETVRCYLNE